MMSKGHMLADVVTIIGTQVRARLTLTPTPSLTPTPTLTRTSCSARSTARERARARARESYLVPRMRAARGGVLPAAGRRVMPARDAAALDGTPGHTRAGRDQGAPLGRCWLVATMGGGWGGCCRAMSERC